MDGCVCACLSEGYVLGAKFLNKVCKTYHGRAASKTEKRIRSISETRYPPHPTMTVGENLFLIQLGALKGGQDGVQRGVDG